MIFAQPHLFLNVVVKMLFPFSEPFPHAALNGEGKCECIELLYLPLLLFVFHHFHRLTPRRFPTFSTHLFFCLFGEKKAQQIESENYERTGEEGWENGGKCWGI